MTLHGHVAATHPLSPRRAFSGLPPSIRSLVDYSPASLWEQETNQLPAALGASRRRFRQFAQDFLRPYALTTDLEPYGPSLDIVLTEAARHGLLSDILPFPFGSLSLRQARYPLHWAQSIKMEELSVECGGLALAIGANALGIMPLLLSGSLTVGRKFILPACRKNLRGQPTLFSFAITEPSGGSDVEDSDGARHYIPRTLASRVEGGWRLNGRKVFISGGDRADFITVFAALAGEGMESWTCFLLEGNNPGLTIGRNELKMGQRASAATELIFEDAIVPDSHVIGGLRRGWAINRAVLNFSRIPVGAIALGIARGAAERATEFACQTKLGGKRLIDYQDIQLEVAQMLLDTSAMRAMVWQSAATWTPTQARASMTKVFCADMAMQTCQRAMNLMGNQGCLQENGAEKAYRDARLTQIYEGTNQINRLSVIEDQLEALELLMAGRG